MNRRQAGKLGGLTTWAAGHGTTEAARQASMDRFQNEAEKKLHYTRMALKRWGRKKAA